MSTWQEKIDAASDNELDGMISWLEVGVEVTTKISARDGADAEWNSIMSEMQNRLELMKWNRRRRLGIESIPYKLVLYKDHLYYYIEDGDVDEGDFVYESNLAEHPIYRVMLRDGRLGIFRFRNVWVPLKRTDVKKIIASTDPELDLPKKPYDTHQEKTGV